MPTAEGGGAGREGPGRSDRTRDLIPAVVLLVVGVTTVRLAAGVSDVLTIDPLGGDFLPRILGIVLIALSVVLLVADLLGIDVRGAEAAVSADDGRGSMGSAPPPPLTPESVRRVVLFLATMVVYAVLMVVVGYLPASLLSFAAMIWIGGERSLGRIALGSLVITASLYLLFAVIFGILVPTGMILG